MKKFLFSCEHFSHCHQGAEGENASSFFTVRQYERLEILEEFTIDGYSRNNICRWCIFDDKHRKITAKNQRQDSKGKRGKWTNHQYKKNRISDC